MNRAAYLSRIGTDEINIAADERSLRLLQRNHLSSVPFENLDIHWKRPIVLNTEKFYRKIVEEKRGGFCYELNGLFNELLRDVGFETRLVSGRVYAGEKGFGPEFDHMAIIVSIGEQEFLADVGFGDFIAGPLRIEMDVEQADLEGVFVVRSDESGFQVAKKVGDEWIPECMFGYDARELLEFAGMCEFHQHSPDSHFTQGKVCSILTAAGRKTLTDQKFIVTSNSEKNELTIKSIKEFNELLRREFGIIPPEFQ